MKLSSITDRSPLQRLIIIFSVALLGGGLGCIFGMRSAVGKTCPHCQSHSHAGTDWLRNELDTSAAQNEKLDQIDEKFQNRKHQLQSALNAANRKLGETIINEKEFTQPVEESVEMIHHSMADLQKASIEHLFEMKKVLEPEQFEKLLKITGDTLGE